MTNKDAISIIKIIGEDYIPRTTFQEVNEALALAIKALEDRPQGEWEESHIVSCGTILRMQYDVVEHKCKSCGRWSIQWRGTITDRYCSNCGADMKGGAE